MPSDKHSIPPEFLAQQLRSHQMRQETQDELLLDTWSFLPNGAKELHFILEGNLSWESKSGSLLRLPAGAIAPDVYDPPGAFTPNLLQQFKVPKQYRLTPMCQSKLSIMATYQLAVHA